MRLLSGYEVSLRLSWEGLRRALLVRPPFLISFVCTAYLTLRLSSSLVGLPAIALLTLRQNRISGFLGAFTAFVLQRVLSYLPSFIVHYFMVFHPSSPLLTLLPVLPLL
jgi:hypothetical protein